MKPIGLFKRGGRVPKSLFLRSQTTPCLFLSAFQSTLLKHAGEVFFVLRNADFFKFKNVSKLSWGNVLLIRVLYREQIMRHGWSVTLTYCYSFTAFLRFLTNMRIERNFWCLMFGWEKFLFGWEKKRNFCLVERNFWCSGDKSDVDRTLSFYLNKT